MTTLAAVWIDHSRAFIVKTNKLGDPMVITELGSDVPPHHKGGVTAEHLTITNQNAHENKRDHELQKFCKEIITHLHDSEEIVVMGPGQAKFNLKNCIEDVKALAPKLMKVEATDQFNRESELKEAVKQILNLPRP